MWINKDAKQRKRNAEVYLPGYAHIPWELPTPIHPQCWAPQNTYIFLCGLTSTIPSSPGERYGPSWVSLSSLGWRWGTWNQNLELLINLKWRWYKPLSNTMPCSQVWVVWIEGFIQCRAAISGCAHATAEKVYSQRRMLRHVEKKKQRKEKQKHSSLVPHETQASLPNLDSESLPSLFKTFLFLISGSNFVLSH